MRPQSSIPIARQFAQGLFTKLDKVYISRPEEATDDPAAPISAGIHGARMSSRNRGTLPIGLAEGIIKIARR